MSNWIRSILTTALMGLSLVALGAVKTTLLSGTIVGVDANGTITVATPARGRMPASQLTVATDANTVVTLDRKPAALADLKPDMIVAIRLAGGTAIHVVARTPPVVPLNGTIVSLDASGNLTVATPARGSVPAGQVTLATDTGTTVTLDGRSATLADLKPQMSVQVKPPTGTASSLVARTPPATSVAGTIGSIDVGSGMMSVAPSMMKTPGEMMNIQTNANTKVKVDNKPAGVGDLRNGMFAVMSVRLGMALTINAQTPPPVPLAGTIISIDDSGAIVVETPGTPPVQTTVVTGAQTLVTVDGKQASLTVLRPDMSVEILPATGTATSIHAHTPLVDLRPLVGTIVGTDGANITVQTWMMGSATGTQTTVATNSDTKVTINGRTASPADLVVGMSVEVMPFQGTATTIQAADNRPTSGPGMGMP